MSNDDPQSGIEPTAGDGPGDADSWVEQWISLFENTGDGPPPPRAASGEDLEASALPADGPAHPVDGLVDGSLDAGIEEEEDEEDVDPDHDPDDESGLDAAEADEGVDAERVDNDDLAAIEAWQRAQERNRRQARLRANQRAARQMQRQLPERSAVQVAGAGPSSLGRPTSGAPSTRRVALVAVGVLALIGLAGYLMVGLGADGATTAGTIAPVGPVAVEPSEEELGLTVGAAVAPATLEELALSTVQLVGLDEDLQPQCAGSGVIVATDGTILTNAHVVRSDAECSFTTVGVGVTVDASSPPELLYRAEVVLLRLGVDLAVLRIAGPLTEDGDAAWPRSFPAAPLGDSDTVELGDPVRVLGYPVIGGDTITLTTGSVSGFTSQVGLGNRALIKTDASISAGNSGGLAIDADGRVVGIPTKARASEQGPAVDCRPVSDTNGDGVIDDADGCVPVGGFLNGIRPINLSLPLLAAAGTSDPIRSEDDPTPPPPVDLTAVELFNPRFSLGVTEDNLPLDEVTSAVAGIPRLCFFVDWEGIPVEASTDGSWYLDNEIQTARAAYSGRIRAEETGQHFWHCIEDDDGLDAGVYEIVFYVDREVFFVEAIELTEVAVDEVEVTWKNETGVELCGLAINPLATSRQIGLDELPVGITIPPAGEWVTSLPQGSVVVEAYDCNDEAVANQFDGLDIVEAVVLQIESEQPPTG